ncbi:MAG: BamA/TamA family outer membrane protein [Nannocystis sp.]|nr:BamA/TamA family outer membrane protein [Nannocystis sp.]MBA3545713.1 BamA/TamA family outer membrane protein [Nannocystis sp.]
MIPLRTTLLALGCATLSSGCLGGRIADVRGVESYITRIELEGVHRFKKKELLAYLNIGESSRLVWKPKYPFSEAMLPIDAERILQVYQAYGYYDAEVVSMVPFTKVGRTRLFGRHPGERRPGKTTITIVVREGAPTKVTDLEVHFPEGAPEGPKGDPPDPKATPQQLANASMLREGDTFEIPLLNGSNEQIRGKMQDRGYAFAEVEERAVVDPGRGVEVDFDLRPGPFVRIGEITIEGLVGVPEKYVRNEIDFAPNHRYSPALKTRIEQAIYAMDVFQSVSIAMDDQPSRPGRVDLTIRVVESKTQSIKVGPGIGIDPVRWEERVSMLYSHKNFGKNLTRFDLRVTAGYAELPSLLRPEAHGPLLRIEPKFQQKGFLEKRTTWTLAPGFELGIWQGYQFYSPTLRMGPSRFFGRHVQLELTYNAHFVDFFNVSPALNAADSIVGRDFRDPYFVSYLEPELTFYFVDSILKPKNGAILGLLYDIAGLGGHFSFQKFQPTLRGYYTPHERVTLAARASVGFIFPFGPNAGAPIDMKLYLGGSDTVRGWGLRRLSPRVLDAMREDGTCGTTDTRCRGVPVGGRTMVLANFETRVRMVDKLSAVAFFDMGDVRAGTASFSPKNWNYSVGPGLRYDSPIGVFRLDAGFRLNETDQSEGERIWAIHFGLGETF